MVDGPAMLVERVTAAATAPLRDRVLRAGSPPDPATWAGWDDPGWATFAISAGAAGYVATATVRPEACPWRPEASGAWRLRGMAADLQWRSRGAGRFALEAALTHVGDAGGRLVWCNARTGALGFYERAGFVIEGDEFDIAGIGPHRPMVLPLD